MSNKTVSAEQAVALIPDGATVTVSGAWMLLPDRTLAALEGRFLATGRPRDLTAMFLLAVPTTLSLMNSFNSGGELALADVLDSLWNYLAGRIMPIAAALAIIGAILNFAAARPWLRLVACSMVFLTVSALWQLVVAMM